jgi:hypothetical protein
MTRLQSAFGALILAQAAHSTEEYVGRLWESFPPARLISGLVSQDLERGFLILNLSLVVFGLSCWLWPVRRGWPIAIPLACTYRSPLTPHRLTSHPRPASALDTPPPE